MEVPIGTIMSGLSRARQAFRVALNNELTRSAISTRPDPRVLEADELFVCEIPSLG
jgi:hypothetical protein